MIDIIVFSRAIQTYKSSELFETYIDQPQIGGFVCLVRNNKRFFYFFDLNLWLPMESNDSNDVLPIGRFNFSKKSFDFASEYLYNIDTSKFKTIIIDEIGKLELEQNIGLFPAFIDFFNRTKIIKSNCNLIVVVRDTLCDLFVQLFNINRMSIKNSSSAFNNKFIGIVACGGESKRMKTPKWKLDYHGQEQYKWVYNQIVKLNILSVISINESQTSVVDWKYNFIVDDSSILPGGPFKAVLSAYRRFKNRSIVLVGVDYPFVNAEVLSHLIDQDNSSFYDLTIYCNEHHIDETLIAIYHPSALKVFEEYANDPNISIKKLLPLLKVNRISFKQPLPYLSVDTSYEFNAIKKLL